MDVLFQCKSLRKEVVQVCTTDGFVPDSIAEALRMAHASMDYLNSPVAADLPAAACGQALTALGQLQAKVTAAHAALLRGARRVAAPVRRRRCP